MCVWGSVHGWGGCWTQTKSHSIASTPVSEHGTELPPAGRTGQGLQDLSELPTWWALQPPTAPHFHGWVQ